MRGIGVAPKIETVYTEGVMPYLRNTTISFLSVALALFAGGVCLMPMSAQAMEVSAASITMDMTDGLNRGDDIADTRSASVISVSQADTRAVVLEDTAAVTAGNPCVVSAVVGCVSQPARAIAAQQVSGENGADLLAQAFGNNQLSPPLLFSSGATDLAGARPPLPNILSSVFKKE